MPARLRDGVAGKQGDELARAIAYPTKTKPTEAFKNNRRLVLGEVAQILFDHAGASVAVLAWELDNEAKHA